MFRRLTRPISPSARREERIFYLFILPWLIGVVVFSAGPVLGMLGLSFTDWRISLDDLQFIGLDNYAKLFDDPIFWTSVGNTLYIVVGRVVFGVSFALLLAVLLNQKVPGIAFFRAVYYLPTVTAGVAVALVWIWIFNPRLGILNYSLKQIGIPGSALDIQQDLGKAFIDHYEHVFCRSYHDHLAGGLAGRAKRIIRVR